jgi:CheY-like chemotaxis protein
LSQPRPQASSILKPDVSQKKRILVVDDEVDITTVFKLGLEEADLQVDAYTDPVLALSEYKPGSEQKTS